jgi:hypothetical protein
VYFCKVKKANLIKKYSVLGILFLLPITVYLFFASGVNNFGKLPILTENVSEISELKDLHGTSVQLSNHITILGFFGTDVESKKANAFNLAHKIYKKYYQFKDFQFVILIDENQRIQAFDLINKLSEIENPKNWKFVIADSEASQEIFYSLNTTYLLDENNSSPYVFVIDYERSLRGRRDDKESGVLYGFDARDYSIINNKMDDDIKVILAEYRLALRKNKDKDQ